MGALWKSRPTRTRCGEIAHEKVRKFYNLREHQGENFESEFKVFFKECYQVAKLLKRDFPSTWAVETISEHLLMGTSSWTPVQCLGDTVLEQNHSFISFSRTLNKSFSDIWIAVILNDLNVMNIPAASWQFPWIFSFCLWKVPMLFGIFFILISILWSSYFL